MLQPSTLSRHLSCTAKGSVVLTLLLLMPAGLNGTGVFNGPSTNVRPGCSVKCGRSLLKPLGSPARLPACMADEVITSLVLFYTVLW